MKKLSKWIVMSACLLLGGLCSSGVFAADDGCRRAGCSGQLCVDSQAPPTFSTCEWRPTYACFQAAECARQADGSCAWTETPQLKQCLQEQEGAGSRPVVFKESH